MLTICLLSLNVLKRFSGNIKKYVCIFYHLSMLRCCRFNTLGPRQNGHHFADDIFKCIFLNGNVWIPIKISYKFVPKGPINIIPVLVQIMAWCRSGHKPLSEAIMVNLPTHICVTRPQWVKKREWPVYPACSIAWMLMTWLSKEPGHRQPWYWPSSHETSKLQHKRGPKFLSL